MLHPADLIAKCQNKRAEICSTYSPTAQDRADINSHDNDGIDCGFSALRMLSQTRSKVSKPK